MSTLVHGNFLNVMKIECRHTCLRAVIVLGRYSELFKIPTRTRSMREGYEFVLSKIRQKS